MLLVAHLPTLRVVHNEAARQQRELESDARHIAYDVVRCVANSEQLLGERLKRVAVVALNFEQRETSLTQRRDQLQQEFRIGEDAYMGLEERAFQQVAGLLLSIDVSPCASLEQPTKEVAALKHEWQALGDFEAVRLIEMGFARLRLSRDHETAVEEAGRILESIPRAVEHIVGADGGTDDPILTLMLIVRRIARSLYGDWSSMRHRGNLLDQGLLLTYLDKLHWGEWEEEDLTMEVALDSRGYLIYPRTRTDAEIISKHTEMAARTFRVLAEIMIELESKDAWDGTARAAG